MATGGHLQELQLTLFDIWAAAGDKFSFALTASGKLFTWGAKGSGCLVLQTATNLVEPTPVSEVGGARAVEVRVKCISDLAKVGIEKVTKPNSIIKNVSVMTHDRVSPAMRAERGVHHGLISLLWIAGTALACF